MMSCVLTLRRPLSQMSPLGDSLRRAISRSPCHRPGPCVHVQGFCAFLFVKWGLPALLGWGTGVRPVPSTYLQTSAAPATHHDYKISDPPLAQPAGSLGTCSRYGLASSYLNKTVLTTTLPVFPF